MNHCYINNGVQKRKRNYADESSGFVFQRKILEQKVRRISSKKQMKSEKNQRCILRKHQPVNINIPPLELFLHGQAQPVLFRNLKKWMAINQTWQT